MQTEAGHLEFPALSDFSSCCKSNSWHF